MDGPLHRGPPPDFNDDGLKMPDTQIMRAIGLFVAPCRHRTIISMGHLDFSCIVGAIVPSTSQWNAKMAATARH